jgi:NADH-ubiquinone oxidoreductase chain 3
MFPGFVLVDLYFIFMKMNSFIIYILFVIFVAVLLLALNVLLSSHNPYMEKKTAFECGFHSFLGQNRTQFTISFFIFALLFLLFDLEILLIYPYTVSAFNNSAYGLLIMLIFFLLLTGGLVFELGKKALTIYSKQKQSFFII